MTFTYICDARITDDMEMHPYLYAPGSAISRDSKGKFSYDRAVAEATAGTIYLPMTSHYGLYVCERTRSNTRARARARKRRNQRIVYNYCMSLGLDWIGLVCRLEGGYLGVLGVLACHEPYRPYARHLPQSGGQPLSYSIRIVSVTFTHILRSAQMNG